MHIRCIAPLLPLIVAHLVAVLESRLLVSIILSSFFVLAGKAFFYLV